MVINGKGEKLEQRYANVQVEQRYGNMHERKLDMNSGGATNQLS
jgi:hypothetical protein